MRRINQLLIIGFSLFVSLNSYAQIPGYEGFNFNLDCSNAPHLDKFKKELSTLGNITEYGGTWSIERKPKLSSFNKGDMLTIPFPQLIIDTFTKDKKKIGEVCITMYEIDFHKIAYHLFYVNRAKKDKYKPVGTIVVKDTQKAQDFAFCKKIASSMMEDDRKEGIYRQSYEVGIGIPFGRNKINQFNRDRLKGIPPEAVQCQIRAILRPNVPKEYILYYGWITEEIENGKKVIYNIRRVVDRD